MSEIYEQLTAPFTHTFKKPGSNLDYITGEQVTSRLNEDLGWDGWSFRVLEHGYDENADEFWCLGELTAGSTIRHQFGSQKPNRYASGKNEGKIIDLGFDMKGAATDALKKCASLIGVGLYLHEKESSQQRAPQRPVQAAQRPPADATPATDMTPHLTPDEMKQEGITTPGGTFPGSVMVNGDGTLNFNEFWANCRKYAISREEVAAQVGGDLNNLKTMSASACVDVFNLLRDKQKEAAPA